MTEIKRTKLKDLHTDLHNANRGTMRGTDLLNKSIEKFDIGRGILIDQDGNIIAGNKTVECLIDRGFEDVIIVPTDGKTLVATQRELTEDEAREMAVADNRTSEVGLEWSVDELALINNINLNDWWKESELEEMGLIEKMELESPDDFKEYDDNIETDYCCPKCGYEWSGEPK